MELLGWINNQDTQQGSTKKHSKPKEELGASGRMQIPNKFKHAKVVTRASSHEGR